MISPRHSAVRLNDQRDGDEKIFHWKSGGSGIPGMRLRLNRFRDDVLNDFI